jgi:guanylate kinase
LIFVKPPNFEVLRSRLLNRKTEDEATIKQRLDRVPMELDAGKQFDYQVVNNDLQTAVREVEQIVAKQLGFVPL